MSAIAQSPSEPVDVDSLLCHTTLGGPLWICDLTFDDMVRYGGYHPWGQWVVGTAHPGQEVADVNEWHFRKVAGQPTAHPDTIDVLELRDGTPCDWQIKELHQREPDVWVKVTEAILAETSAELRARFYLPVWILFEDELPNHDQDG